MSPEPTTSNEKHKQVPMIVSHRVTMPSHFPMSHAAILSRRHPLQIPPPQFRGSCQCVGSLFSYKSLSLHIRGDTGMFFVEGLFHFLLFGVLQSVQSDESGGGEIVCESPECRKNTVPIPLCVNRLSSNGITAHGWRTSWTVGSWGWLLLLQICLLARRIKVVRSHSLGEFWKSALHKSMSAKATGAGEERMDNDGAKQ